MALASKSQKGSELNQTDWSVITKYLPLAKKHAYEYFLRCHKRFEMDELLSIATEALVDAALHFDRRRGSSFGSYARPWVRAALGRYCFREIDRSMRLVSISIPVGKGNSTLGDYVIAPNRRLRAIISRNCDAILRMLPRRDRRLMGLRFGLNGPPHTLEALARNEHMTPEGVRQALLRAFKTIQKRLPGKRLEDFYEGDSCGTDSETAA